jgi:hypothetical protein
VGKISSRSALIFWFCGTAWTHRPKIKRQHQDYHHEQENIVARKPVPEYVDEKRKSFE